jgi:Holliday junction resolvase
MTPRGSQRKGSRAERELASLLTEVLGTPCHKGSSPFLPGIIAPDIQIAGNIHIEVKRRERFSIPAALRQSKSDAGTRVAAVAHRPNREPWMLTVDLADLPRLAQAVTAMLTQTEGTHV